MQQYQYTKQPKPCHIYSRNLTLSSQEIQGSRYCYLFSGLYPDLHSCEFHKSLYTWRDCRQRLEPDLKALHFTSVDVERSCSRYKAILLSNRGSFTSENLQRRYVLLYCNSKWSFFTHGIPEKNCEYFSSMGSVVFPKKSSLLTINFNVCEVLEI